MTGRQAALLAPPLLWLSAFLVLPAGILAAAAFGPEGLSTLAKATTWTLLGRSLGYASFTTVLCLALAYPAALFIAGCAPRARTMLLFLVVVPFWTNLLVRTYALIVILRKADALYTTGAVLVGLVHSFLPFMILPLVTSLEKVPRRLLEASQDLGASPWQTFWRVTVPLTAPGIAAGCLLVFIPVLGIFALPEFLGGAKVYLVGMHINLLFIQDGHSPAGAALTLLLLVATCVLLAVYHRFRRSEGLA